MLPMLVTAGTLEMLLMLITARTLEMLPMLVTAGTLEMLPMLITAGTLEMLPMLITAGTLESTAALNTGPQSLRRCSCKQAAKRMAAWAQLLTQKAMHNGVNMYVLQGLPRWL